MEPVDSKPDIFRENTIDRLYTVHPNLDECFFLRMLLVNVPGPISFQQLKIVDGVITCHFPPYAQCSEFIGDSLYIHTDNEKNVYPQLLQN